MLVLIVLLQFISPSISKAPPPFIDKTHRVLIINLAAAVPKTAPPTAETTPVIAQLDLIVCAREFRQLEISCRTSGRQGGKNSKIARFGDWL